MVKLDMKNGRRKEMYLAGLIFFLILFFLFQHFILGITRYFDSDEFAHLHWGYAVSIGEKPYKDFFYLFPPFFLYPVAAVFSLFGRNLSAVLAARVLIFAVFAGVTFLVFLIGSKLKGKKYGLLAAYLLTILPLPEDKMIEVRPDLVAALFALGGIYFFFLAEEKRKRFFYAISGLSFSVSLGFVPKTAFFLIPVGLVLFLRFMIRSVRNLEVGTMFKNRLLPFAAGFILPGLMLLALLVYYGNIPFDIYSMTRMSSMTTAVLGMKFYMRPDIFFYQNDTYYGLGGYSLPYVVNLVMYIAASVFAVGRFAASFSHDDSRKCIREFIIGGCFFANLYAFVHFYPLKHAQYLITVAPFIALYFADLLTVVFLRGMNRAYEAGLALLAVCVLLLAVSAYRMNLKKFQWTNTQNLNKTVNLLSEIPPDQPVFDLTGESIMFPDGYYFCCVPYGQYTEALEFPLPNIERDMARRGTKYVHAGSDGRFSVIPPSSANYIQDNFVKTGADQSLWVRKS